MKKITRYKKFIAAFLLVVMISELAIPATAFALTSGPSQPEAQKFEPAGTSNMVDLFSGDLSYNIPLMDVGGYPINLAYQSGFGMDDEASWVGAGWTLNPGAVTRQLRGLPDDFNGDQVTKESHKKPLIKIGAGLTVKGTLFGFVKNSEVGFKVNVFKDNYFGIGADLGLNASLSLTQTVAGKRTGTLGFQDKYFTGTATLGGSLSTSSREGVTISPNFNLSIIHELDRQNDFEIGKSLGYSYNSRQGLKEVTLGSSFSINSLPKQFDRNSLSVSGSMIVPVGDSHTPSIEVPMKTEAFTFDFDAGAITFGKYFGAGATGTYSKTEVSETIMKRPAYGYLHSENGKHDLNALMDVNREKDIPYFKGVPAIAIPVVTNDIFTVTNQEGVMQFRPFRSGTGITFDNLAENKTRNTTAGLTAGAGGLFQGGGSYYRANMSSRTEKWTSGNMYSVQGDFQEYDTENPAGEPAYFKRVGEKVKSDDDFFGLIKDDRARAVEVSFLGQAIANSKFIDKDRNAELVSDIKRTARDRRGYTFSYLTGLEASRLGLDRTIKSYKTANTWDDEKCEFTHYSMPRIFNHRKPGHISEVTVTNPSGQRFVYGIPVYNKYQEEVTFSVKDQKKEKVTAAAYKALRDNGKVAFVPGDETAGNSNGRDNYYNKEILPPYTTSYLLSGILSPDYVDKTGNGISSDDLGTAVKFNYTILQGDYRWRSPFDQLSTARVANYNEGFLSDGKDDKGSYVYGEKEVWYLHSIESKTMIAVFELADRLDGLGASDIFGGKNTTTRLKRLNSIKLYSKADLVNGGLSNATPIKTVHFTYEYILCPGIPNHNEGSNIGKLTLTKVHFTFGKNGRGATYPYEFSYHSQATPYGDRQVDRWGTYKNKTTNPQYDDPAIAGTETLNNSEWPYSTQDKTTAKANAAVWQLSQVILPSGGKIKIDYESDDYAYVQNRRAMIMCTLNGLQTTGSNTGLIGKDELLVNLPTTCASDEDFIARYIDDMEYIYYKCFIRLTKDDNTYEQVGGYAKIIKEQCRLKTGSNNIGIIKLQMHEISIPGFPTVDENPISRNTWQFMRLSLPQVAFPGYDNSDLGGSDLKKLIKSLKDAVSNLSELGRPFNERAKEKGFADVVKLDRSWVRLYAPGNKLGGGSRVSQIEMTDEWAVMDNTAGTVTGTYGQVFNYTTTGEENGPSSGVASYEPLIGADENPFRQPITFRQEVKMGLDNYHYIEEPLCESYFPAATIGYSRVKVTSYGKDSPESATRENRTGYTVSEFFTAREFPTLVEQVPNDPKFNTPRFILRTLFGDITDRVVISQGYKVEINDMHGKPKKDQVFNTGGSLVSMVEYFYKTENPDAEFKRLSNTASTVNAKGEVDNDAIIGQDIEMYTDMRQEVTQNKGTSVGAYGGGIPGFGLIPILPFGKVTIATNKMLTSFNSASTIKIVQKYGILEKIRKTDNGSTLTTENLLWDEETGDVLLTKTQNEFEDPVYSFTYPAHWAYTGMGPAYENLGMILQDFSTESGVLGKIESKYESLLHPGDELSTIFGFRRFWVTTEGGTAGGMRLIDVAGNLVSLSHNVVKVYRSGRRNMSSATLGTVVTLQNPIQEGHIVIDQAKQILDVASTEFKQEWAMPVNSRWGVTPQLVSCPPTSVNVVQNFLYSAIAYRYGRGRRGLYSQARDNQSVGGLIADVYGDILQDEEDPLSKAMENFLYGLPAGAYGFSMNTIHRDFVIPGFRYRYTLQNGDQGRFGDGTITFECVTQDFNDLINNNIDATQEQMRAILENQYCLRAVSIAGQCQYELVKVGPPEASPCDPIGGGDNVPMTKVEGSSSSTLSSTGKIILRFSIYVPAPDKEECVEPLNQQINPYFAGILGNWRPFKTYAYLVDRTSLASTTTFPGSTDIRRSGYFKSYVNFWNYNSTEKIFKPSGATDADWVNSNQITGFSSKSLEIENKDALNRYSTAQFGYLETLPVAVAANTQHREIAYDGFEDYNLKFTCVDPTCPPASHFDFKQQIVSSGVFCNTVGCISSTQVHSGKYSLELKGPALTMTRPVSTAEGIATGNITSRHNDGRYILAWNELSKGFAPEPGKRYVMSFWVYEGHNPSSAETSLDLRITGVNGGNNLLQGVKCAVVEDWKRVWIDFALPAESPNFSFTLNPGGATKYVDDIRIFPYEGQLKSYAYDERNLRLMADLDENNFATFYEYDDEGMLIRVKKETERGIMTLKETRSSYRNRQ